TARPTAAATPLTCESRALSDAGLAWLRPAAAPGRQAEQRAAPISRTLGATAMTPPLTKGTSTTTSPHARPQGRSRLAGAALAMILAVPFAAPAAASPAQAVAPSTSVSALPAAART